MSWYTDDDARFDAWVTGNWGEDSIQGDERETCSNCGSEDTVWIPSVVATTEMRFCKACQHPYAADWYGREE